MPYDSSICATGRHQLDLLRDEERLRLALRVVSHVGVLADNRLADLSGIDVFLGDFWAWFGSEERRQLARAKDHRKQFALIVLDAAGLLPGAYNATDPLRIDLVRLQRAADRFVELSERRAAAEAPADPATPAEAPAPPGTPAEGCAHRCEP